jgi:hypothetical protein
MSYIQKILSSNEMPKYRIRFARGEAKTIEEISKRTPRGEENLIALL